MEKLILILIAFISHSLFTHAQSIPNNGFENWTSMGTYNNPDNWASLNDLTATMNTFTCVKGTPGVVGTMELIRDSLLWHSQNGIVC